MWEHALLLLTNVFCYRYNEYSLLPTGCNVFQKIQVHMKPSNNREKLLALHFVHISTNLQKCDVTKPLITLLIVPLTFFLVQHTERLQQLMFGTLHHAQPGLAFILKRSEVTNSEENRNEAMKLPRPPKVKYWISN